MVRLPEIHGESHPRGALPSSFAMRCVQRCAQRAFVRLTHDALALGIGVAVADDFVAARVEGGDHLGAGKENSGRRVIGE